MISFIVRFKFASEDRAEIAAALRIITPAVRQEPGCITFIPHLLEDDPDTVLIYEQYRDAEALAAHRQTPHFQKYVAGVIFQKMLERNFEYLVALA
jgi:quinol monooxygenase YgiN